LLGIKPDVQTNLEFFFSEQGGANDYRVGNTGLVAHPKTPIGQQFSNPDHRAIFLKTENIGNGKGLIQQNAGPCLQGLFGDAGIQVADVISAIDAHQDA